MTDHDPMCNAYDESRAICNCRFIAKVREDERRECYTRPFDEASRLWREQGQRDERARIRAAIEALHTDPNGVRLRRSGVLAVIDGDES